MFFKHSDLGMRNVLLGENGHILLSFTSQWPEVDHIPSSSDWIAPEVRDAFEFFGSREKVHFSADWWSLGAILFYLVTGKVEYFAKMSFLFLPFSVCIYTL